MRHLTCQYCGKDFETSDRRKVRKYCSMSCASKKNNAGKVYSAETRLKMSEIAKKQGRGLGNQYAKGHRWTKEEKKQIADRSRKNWQNQEYRSKVLSKSSIKGNTYRKGIKWSDDEKKAIGERSKKMWANPTKKREIISKRVGENSPNWNPDREEVKQRLGLALFYRFTKRQRLEWLGKYCVFCGSTENLELDHKLAVINGGTNVRENAQTLCKRCNLWKRNHIDYAIARKRGELLGNPEVAELQDYQQPSVVNGTEVATKVQRLTGEEPTNKPDTSAPHCSNNDDIVRTYG